ncbi:MAG TPA: O-antigen ligase family protein [Vicinamibacterales bacterium]|jgi:O-antigen ligase|nr:O-antigen ligase family protein [Vicinamibacterales bacterium]
MSSSRRAGRAAAAALAIHLMTAAFAFGGVYVWSAAALSGSALALLVGSRARLPSSGALRTLDFGLIALLGAVLLQALPLPVEAIRVLSPGRDAFAAAMSLRPESPRTLSLSLGPRGTLHAWLSLFSIAATFWAARAIFARGGVRTCTTLVACGAILLVLVAFAQHASGTQLAYGFWQPRDAGARPLGPFINRNHLGTWSILAICLCVGYLQWRDVGVRPARSWRGRVARLFESRRLILQLAVVLLASVIALAASRAALVALACSAGYVAVAGRGGARRSLAVVGVLALIAMLGYGDGRQLLRRVDETRATGMTARLAIWRDALPVIRDFPVTGVGAGNFATAMRLYQTTPRTYYHNEAHNQLLQIVVEGGILLTVPAIVGIMALVAAARARLRDREDPLASMRTAAAAALIGVTVQSLWETGLTLPANGMFAAVLAGLLVHRPAAPLAEARMEPR